jgi:CheY-like chemotaxis protein
MGHTFAQMFFGERTRVLVIGDDPAGLAGLERCLGREAFEVTGVADAREALRAAVRSGSWRLFYWT